MSSLQKIMTTATDDIAIRHVYNDVDKSLTVNGFLVSKVGVKVAAAYSTTTVAGDTVTFTFSDNGVALYSIKVIYTDGSRADLLSAERMS